MTGSRPQLYNGVLLLVTFFACRLVWGTYQSIRVYQDVWAALHHPGTLLATDPGVVAATEKSVDAGVGMMRFAGDRTVPIWLACMYLGSNVVLNTLNFYWFGKMIETVKKRFQPPRERRRSRDVAVPVENGKMGGEERVRGDLKTKVVVDMDETGRSRVVVEKREVRRRKA
jgi:hypothetical protein